VASAKEPSRLSRTAVRLLEERDLDNVARLFLARFRKTGALADEPAHGDLVNYMRQLYLGGAGAEAGTESMIQIDARGDVGAFIGVIPMTYQLDGVPLKAGVSGVLMSSSENGTSLAAIQLLRELHRRPLDLIFTDSANRSSMALGTAMKYKILSSESLEWAHVFQPAAVVLHKLAGRLRWMPAGLLRPLARAADFAAAPLLNRKFRRGASPGWSDAAIDAATFVEMAPRFLAGFRLRPAWAPPELSWLVKQAGLRQSAGPLHFRVVRDSSGDAVGCYAFYGERGGVARVIHAAATRRAWSALLAKILDTTESMGCIGVHGAARKEMMPHVYSFPGMFFYYAGGLMIYSSRADVRERIESDDLFVGGLAGDRWTRLSTDQFGLLPPAYA
jgi:hypothetical protein